jgi:hypothetical protein
MVAPTVTAATFASCLVNETEVLQPLLTPEATERECRASLPGISCPWGTRARVPSLPGIHDGA